MTKRFIIVVFLLCWLTSLTSYGQAVGSQAHLLKLTQMSDSLSKKTAAEKLYLQFDKPYYAAGDTIWFKAYLLNASYLTASAKSAVMYVDIVNDSNRMIKHYASQLQSGLGWGNIALDEKDYTPGVYILRAYTRWMRNLGDEAFFYQRFEVINSAANNWLVNTAMAPLPGNVPNDLRIKMRFSNIDKTPDIVSALQLEVFNANKVLNRQQLQTGVDGMLDVNIKLPDKISHLTIVAANKEKGKKAVIPVILNRPENADVQFLPEGGSIVAGMPAHIAFKVIGEDGRGIAVSGIIVNKENKPVVSFHALHSGMGSFDFPATAEAYTAKITFPGGFVKTVTLPVAKPSGTILLVKNEMDADSVEVVAGARTDLSNAGTGYFLIGKSRETICYAAIINFDKSNLVKRKIAKSLFPTGIASFTLITSAEQPLNERICFIDHHDNLRLSIKPGQAAYKPRDSISIQLKVTDPEGKPLAGNFSMAVTDDKQVKQDTVKETILTRFLLTSDIKGYVEDPGYYYPVKNADSWKALDNLLLTQGWTNYGRQQATKQPEIKFEAEPEFAVKGRVSNLFNKPVKGTPVVLFSTSPTLIMNTTTNNSGEFYFNHFPRVDTPAYILKAVNKNGKSFNVNITIADQPAPDFKAPFFPALIPWYVNSDSTLIFNVNNSAKARELRYAPDGSHVLKEVAVKAKKFIRNSQNLNGPGNANQVIGEKELENAGKKNLLQLFENSVKGFKRSNIPFSTQPWFLIDNKPIILIINGILINNVYPNFSFQEFDYFLKSTNVEDIKGIEVMSSPAFTTSYNQRYLSTEFNMSIDPKKPDLAFIEITTRSGNMPSVQTPGIYLYKPLAISWPKQFYEPKYKIADKATTTDLRSTIDWKPNIVTDANGEATIHFYASDAATTYTITIEGSDMNGNLGRAIYKCTIR